MVMEAFFLLKAQMEQLSTSQRACSVSMEQTTSVASCLIFSIASKSKLFHFRTKSNSMCYLNRFLACPAIPRFSNRRYQLLEVKRGRALCPLQVPLSVAQLICCVQLVHCQSITVYPLFASHTLSLIYCHLS